MFTGFKFPSYGVQGDDAPAAARPAPDKSGSHK
jgi:hypothetical protein